MSVCACVKCMYEWVCVSVYERERERRCMPGMILTKPRPPAPPTGSLLLLKVVYDSANEKSHIVSEQEIKLSEDPQTVFDDDLPRVIHMQFLGNGSDVETDAIFVGTTEALYRFPLANCARYTGDCCACVASRDPHCGYNPSTKECVVVTGNSGTDSAQLLQDVARGDIGVCSNPPDSDMTPPSSTDSVSMDINMLSTTSTLVFLRPTSKPSEFTPCHLITNITTLTHSLPLLCTFSLTHTRTQPHPQQKES